MPRVRLGAEAARAAGAGTANGSAGCKVILPCVALRSIGCAPAAYLTRRVESVELRATRPGRLQPLGFIGALSQSRAASVGVEIVAGILSGGYDFLTGTGDAVRMSTWQLTPAAKGAYAAGRKLAHEGLVEASPNRSFRIVRHTREDIRDIYWMHAVLAGELTARACQRQDDDTHLVDRLRANEKPLLAAIAARDTAAMEAANWSFHRDIDRAAGAPRLLLMLRSTLRLIPQHFYALVKGWAPVSRTGHAAIVDAFARRDGAAARSAAIKHVEEAGRLVIAHFSDTGYWRPPGQG